MDNMNVYLKEDQIATENLVPGKKVYGEQLFEEKIIATGNLNNFIKIKMKFILFKN